MKIKNYGSERQRPNPYAITSQREILALLRSIEKKRQLIRMMAHGEADAIVTSILEVDIHNDAVIIDCAPDASLNQRIINANKVSFETTLDKIRILFSSTQVTSCLKDDRPAFRIAIPASLVRLQRREFYRINTPIASPVRCIISLPNDGTENVVTAVLQDISGGGIAIFDDSRTLNNTIGHIYKNCKITLPGIGVITTSLVVVNFQEQVLFNDKKRRRIACTFMDMPNSMLNMVQRYIGKLERELNAKRQGLD
ncbi:MAG: flagellar brake protein [Glaciimonas sp.]|nr:flagellar brake protein [Glaciimonas sp.]